MRTAQRMAAYLAIGLATLAGAVPASLARNSRVLDHCMSAGTGIETEERQTDQKPAGVAGVSVDVPIGRVCVGPDAVEGGPSYVRRTTVAGGARVVEVSTTPFMDVLSSGEQPLIRPEEHPAGW